MRPPDRGRGSPQKREHRPVARTARLANQNDSSADSSENLPKIQRIARHMSRRHPLSLSIAAVIAAEMLGGRAQ